MGVEEAGGVDLEVFVAVDPLGPGVGLGGDHFGFEVWVVVVVVVVVVVFGGGLALGIEGGGDPFPIKLVMEYNSL